MALTANREMDHYVDQELRSVPVSAAAHIFKGALVEWGSTGHARPLVGGGLLAGIAYEEMDNSGGSDGDVTGRIYTQGDFGLALAGAAQADVGRPVYATDDATLTFDAQGATFVGFVQGIASAGQIILRLAAEGPVRTAKIEHRSAPFAISAQQSGTTFTNLGAGAAITATLPQNAPAGTEIRFVCMADQALQLAPGPAGGIYVKGSKQADDKYVAISDIGDFIHLIADGDGDWVAVASIGGADADISVES